MGTRPNQNYQSYDLQKHTREHQSALVTWEHVPIRPAPHQPIFTDNRARQVVNSTAVEQRRRYTNKNMHKENSGNPHPFPTLSPGRPIGGRQRGAEDRSWKQRLENRRYWAKRLNLLV